MEASSPDTAACAASQACLESYGKVEMIPCLLDNAVRQEMDHEKVSLARPFFQSMQLLASNQRVLEQQLEGVRRVADQTLSQLSGPLAERLGAMEQLLRQREAGREFKDMDAKLNEITKTLTLSGLVGAAAASQVESAAVEAMDLMLSEQKQELRNIRNELETLNASSRMQKAENGVALVPTANAQAMVKPVAKGKVKAKEKAKPKDLNSKGLVVREASPGVRCVEDDLHPRPTAGGLVAIEAEDFCIPLAEDSLPDTPGASLPTAKLLPNAAQMLSL